MMGPNGLSRLRLSEDIVKGRTVHRTVCQNEAGTGSCTRQEKAFTALAPTALKPIKKPVYHDCRPSEDVVNGRTVQRTVCQNEAATGSSHGPKSKKPGTMTGLSHLNEASGYL